MEMIIFLIGMSVGSIIATITMHIFSASGTLRIDHNNPDKDIYRIEIDSTDAIDKRTRMYLKIDHNANFSQD